MVATAALIIAFVVVAGAVVLVAMSGGPGKAREKLLHRQSGSANRGSGLAITVVIALFGIAIPAVAMVGNNDKKEAKGGVELTSAQKNGREVFAQLCSTCHALSASNAVGRVGPNLDQLRPPKELTLNAIQMGRARGLGQMPSGLVDGEDAEDVADYIAAVAGR